MANFLSLPRELREIIYQMALVSDRSINLWPDRSVKDFRDLSTRKCPARHYEHECRAATLCFCTWSWTEGSKYKLVEAADCPACYPTRQLGTAHKLVQPVDKDRGERETRIDKYWPLCRPCYGLEQHDQYPYQRLEGSISDGVESAILIRDQDALRFVRKKLAPGLLTTCKQIYAEASVYFWYLNTFRLTGKHGWQGLLRFLLTIGPAARRYITSVDVCAPFSMQWFTTMQNMAGYERILDGRSKNNPKLHMVKVSPDVEDELSHIHQVCNIILKDRALRRLNLVIPVGCYFDGDLTHIVNSQHPLRLLVGIQINLMVEWLACLNNLSAFAQLDELNWNLVCFPGSCVRDPDPTIFTGRQLNRLYIRQPYDYLDGVSTLFGLEREVDDFDVTEEMDAWAMAERVNIDDFKRVMRRGTYYN